MARRLRREDVAIGDVAGGDARGDVEVIAVAEIDVGLGPRRGGEGGVKSGADGEGESRERRTTRWRRWSR
jgi:hypothetical protein